MDLFRTYCFLCIFHSCFSLFRVCFVIGVYSVVHLARDAAYTRFRRKRQLDAFSCLVPYECVVLCLFFWLGY